MLPSMDAGLAEAVVTDPPYGIAFMNSEWDDPLALFPEAKGGSKVARSGRIYQAWCERWMRECARILQPGGALCCFGAARMVHRAAAAMRRSGFPDPEVCGWCYQTGVPMSLNVQKVLAKKAAEAARRFEGYGTALKPAWEVILIARKPG